MIADTAPHRRHLDDGSWGRLAILLMGGILFAGVPAGLAGRAGTIIQQKTPAWKPPDFGIPMRATIGRVPFALRGRLVKRSDWV